MAVATRAHVGRYSSACKHPLLLLSMLDATQPSHGSPPSQLSFHNVRVLGPIRLQR